jgi:hypothetical protein
MARCHLIFCYDALLFPGTRQVLGGQTLQRGRVLHDAL